MLDCKILSFSNEYFNEKAEYITFNSLKEGIVSIFEHHQSQTFYLAPGKMMIKTKEKETTFFHGSGFAKIESSEEKTKIEIFAFPIIEDDLNNYEVKDNNYIKECFEIWKKIK